MCILIDMMNKNRSLAILVHTVWKLFDFFYILIDLLLVFALQSLVGTMLRSTSIVRIILATVSRPLLVDGKKVGS